MIVPETDRIAHSVLRDLGFVAERMLCGYYLHIDGWLMVRTGSGGRRRAMKTRGWPASPKAIRGRRECSNMQQKLDENLPVTNRQPEPTGKLDPNHSSASTDIPAGNGDAAPSRGEPPAAVRQSGPPADTILVPSVEPPPDDGLPTLPTCIKTLLIGKRRDLHDQSIFRHVSLVAFLAWVGLGADGLSSSCYGPPEAFEHWSAAACRTIIWRSFWRWRRSQRSS